MQTINWDSNLFFKFSFKPMEDICMPEIFKLTQIFRAHITFPNQILLTGTLLVHIYSGMKTNIFITILMFNR